MDTPSGGGRDSRYSMGYNMSLLSGETAPEMYHNAVHSRPSTSITSALSRSSLSMSSACSANLQRGLKRTSSDVCFDQDSGRGPGSVPGAGDCGSDLGDEGFSPSTQKGSPPSNGKKTKGRVKIKMEYIDNKLRRYTTFSKRKTGIMKKAYELSTLTGTQVMLLVASETGHVYTFATRKLQPMITSETGKALIQTCLNSPDPCPAGGGGERMSVSGFEETELSYNIGDDEQKEEMYPEMLSGNDSSSSSSPAPPPELSNPSRELSLLQQQLRQATSSPRLSSTATNHQDTTTPPNHHQSQPPPPRSPPLQATPAHQSNARTSVSTAAANFARSLVYQTPGGGVVYAAPNGGVIFSLGSAAEGASNTSAASTQSRFSASASQPPQAPQFITIPLPLTLGASGALNASTASSASAGPADLSKSKK
ncbi:serum response factor homolog [Nilaparvata lugens]|uniref:serum response factor homolog n=1 Tax=Nilaparvata lugens TaxID=108931 RepID=UPI000B990E26|nr:serum response factor homolog [Nilaparvata lugens]